MASLQLVSPAVPTHPPRPSLVKYEGILTRAGLLMRIDVDFSENTEVVRLCPGGTRLSLAEKRSEGTGVLVVEVPSGKEVARYPGLGGIEDMVFRSEKGLLVILSPWFAQSLLARDLLFT